MATGCREPGKSNRSTATAPRSPSPSTTPKAEAYSTADRHGLVAGADLRAWVPGTGERSPPRRPDPNPRQEARGFQRDRPRHRLDHQAQQVKERSMGRTNRVVALGAVAVVAGVFLSLVGPSDGNVPAAKAATLSTLERYAVQATGA